MFLSHLIASSLSLELHLALKYVHPNQISVCKYDCGHRISKTGNSGLPSIVMPKKHYLSFCVSGLAYFTQHFWAGSKASV